MWPTVGVLLGNGSHSRCAKDAAGSKGLEVRLDACPAARVRACNGQHAGHLQHHRSTSPSMVYRDSSMRQGRQGCRTLQAGIMLQVMDDALVTGKILPTGT